MNKIVHRGIEIEALPSGGFFTWVRFTPGEPLNRVTGSTIAEVASNIDNRRVNNEGVVG